MTAGPNPGKAQITVRRVDGGVFDLTSFTAHLLGNAGAGRAIEIVPMLGGEEPLNDPLPFDVSGNYGMDFSYDTSPNPAAGRVQIRRSGADKSLADGPVSVFTARGARVRSLRLDTTGRTTWDLCDDGGRPVAAGVYFVRMEAATALSGFQRVVVVR